MALHFANQYGNSRAVPNMLLAVADGGISPKGTFWLFAAVTALGGAWVWFAVPETAGRSLESMDRLFTLPWYQIGRHGNREAEVASGDEMGVETGGAVKGHVQEVEMRVVRSETGGS